MFRSRSSALLVLAACGGRQTPAAPRCPVDGIVTVASQDEVDALATCTSLNKLTIRSGAPLDLAPLAKLERIRDHLVVGPSLAIDHVSFPALREVGGDLAIQSNASVRGVFLPVLANVNDLSIAGNGQLTTVSLPRLVGAASVAVQDNGSLEIIDFSKLASVSDSLGILNNPVLVTLELPTTISTPERRIEGNRALDERQPAEPAPSGGDHE